MDITEDSIVGMARDGYDEHAIAKTTELTYTDIKNVISQALQKRAKLSQTEEAKSENLQKIIDGYFADLSTIASLIDEVPVVDWRVKTKVLELKNSVRNSLFRVLQESGLVPKLTKEDRKLSGWEELMERFKTVKLTQTVEVSKE